MEQKSFQAKSMEKAPRAYWGMIKISQRIQKCYYKNVIIALSFVIIHDVAAFGHLVHPPH